jgi:autotransporter-associated beta strand protein
MNNPLPRTLAAPFLGAGILAILTSTTFAVDRSWNIAAPTEGDFLDGANWSPTFSGSWAAADNAIVANGGTATVSSGTTTITDLFIGNLSTTSGTLKLNAGTLSASRDLVIGRQGATGTVEISGTGLLRGGTTFRVGVQNDAATTAASASVAVSGPSAGITSGTAANGVVVIGAASSTVSGLRATGSVTLSNSATWTHSSNGVFIAGGDNNTANQAGGTGSLLIQSGSLLNITGTGNLAIGRNATAQGTVTVTGGTVTMGGGSIFIGGMNGTTTSGGNGTFTLNSGAVTTAQLSVREGTGTINLNGGTATVTSISEGNGSGTVNFNGTTVKVAADSADFLAGFETPDLNVQSGGFLLDSNGKSVTFTQGASGTGAFTKLGGGTLTVQGQSTYSGGTTVSAGTLLVASGATLGSGGITVGSGGTLNFDYDFSLATGGLTLLTGSAVILDQSLSFTGLTIAGNSFSPGTYDYATLKTAYPAIFADGGSGQISVSAIPEPSSLALIGIGIAAALGIRRKRSTR